MYEASLRKLKRQRLVMLECGAGTAVSSVRSHSEQLQHQGATLIRINPDEPKVSPGTIEIAWGAAKALDANHSLA